MNELTEPLKQPSENGTIITPFYKTGNDGLDRGNHWFGATELVSEGART